MSAAYTHNAGAGAEAWGQPDRDESYNTVHWRTLSTWPRGTALSPAELALAFLPLFARTPTSNPSRLALVTQPNLLPSTVWGLWYQVPCSDTNDSFGGVPATYGSVGGSGTVLGAMGRILGKHQV